MSPKVLLNRLYYEYILVLKLVFTYELFNICRVFLFRVLPLDTRGLPPPPRPPTRVLPWTSWGPSAVPRPLAYSRPPPLTTNPGSAPGYL